MTFCRFCHLKWSKQLQHLFTQWCWFVMCFFFFSFFVKKSTECGTTKLDETDILSRTLKPSIKLTTAVHFEPQMCSLLCYNKVRRFLQLPGVILMEKLPASNACSLTCCQCLLGENHFLRPRTSSVFFLCSAPRSAEPEKLCEGVRKRLWMFLLLSHQLALLYLWNMSSLVAVQLSASRLPGRRWQVVFWWTFRPRSTTVQTWFNTHTGCRFMCVCLSVVLRSKARQTNKLCVCVSCVCVCVGSCIWNVFSLDFGGKTSHCQGLKHLCLSRAEMAEVPSNWSEFSGWL